MKQIVLLGLLAVLTLVLTACASVTTPMHTPPFSKVFTTYNNVPAKNFSKIEPYPDGTPRYLVQVDSPLGASRFETNADTQGLDLLRNGSPSYTIKIIQYQVQTGLSSAFLVGAIAPAKSQQVIDQEIEERERAAQNAHEDYANKISERLKQERELRAEQAHKLKQKGCYDVTPNGFFCYDDSLKLAKHDSGPISKLLVDITRRLIRGELGVTPSEPEIIGQWYVETVTDELVNVTILLKGRLIGETTLDKKRKAGAIYYFEQKTTALSIK